MATSTNKTAAFANPQVYVETPLHPEKLFGALYGLVESFVRSSSKTMKARLDYIRASRGSHMPQIIFKM
ncbi:hypothetical protein TNCV_3417971 [Trichonephila clavipes]|nr:hypothetical protein TNCV_3417971 [Trichonephila clavipes]